MSISKIKLKIIKLLTGSNSKILSGELSSFLSEIYAILTNNYL